MILDRQTHLVQLADKLGEAGVRRVIEPLLRGDEGGDGEVASLEHSRDIEYVRDLGLIAPEAPVRMANPIYAEVVPRELASAVQETLPQETAWYVKRDGGLDIDKLLAAFQTFFRENSEHWLGRFDYREAGPQLLLQAFLQRVVNVGGRIEREYGLGRQRTDLLIFWPEGAGAESSPNGNARFVIECKIVHARSSLEGTVAQGLAQTADYMDRSGCRAGNLVIFDPDPAKPWEDKVFRREESVDDRTIVVWGM